MVSEDSGEIYGFLKGHYLLRGFGDIGERLRVDALERIERCGGLCAFSSTIRSNHGSGLPKSARKNAKEGS